MKLQNPFTISGYAGPEYFCDRVKETETLIGAWRNGRNITLISPRKMGKTGLIKHVFNVMKTEDEDITTIYMDIFPTQNLREFVRLFATSVFGQMESPSHGTLEKITKFVRSCRPTLTFDEFSGVPKVSIDIMPSQEEATLKEIFEYIGRSGKRFCIAIDEFQQICSYPEKGVEALLRSYIQFMPDTWFIFSGSRQHLMAEMFISAKRPFYQSTQMVTIGRIDREAYYMFADRFFREKNTEIPKDTFEYLYDRYDGHTWYIQNILNRLYGMSFTPVLNEVAVECAVNDIVSEYAFAYESLFSAYPAGSIRILKALARDGKVKEPLAGNFIYRHELRAASSVSSALKSMVDNEMVYRSPEGYMVYDRFMAEWLRRLE